MDIINDYLHWIVLGLAVIVIAQWLMMAKTARNLKYIKKSYDAMMNGTGVENLEAVIGSINEKLEDNDNTLSNIEQRLAQVEQKLPLQKSKLAVHRYKAFADSGSDLSFSLALMDEAKNGVVLTSIHSREGMYLYGKPVEKGESSYMLTPEEKKVIDEAK